MLLANGPHGALAQSPAGLVLLPDNVLPRSPFTVVRLAHTPSMSTIAMLVLAPSLALFLIGAPGVLAQQLVLSLEKPIIVREAERSCATEHMVVTTRFRIQSLSLALLLHAQSHVSWATGLPGLTVLDVACKSKHARDPSHKHRQMVAEPAKSQPTFSSAKGPLAKCPAHFLLGAHGVHAANLARPERDSEPDTSSSTTWIHLNALHSFRLNLVRSKRAAL